MRRLHCYGCSHGTLAPSVLLHGSFCNQAPPPPDRHHNLGQLALHNELRRQHGIATPQGMLPAVVQKVAVIPAAHNRASDVGSGCRGHGMHHAVANWAVRVGRILEGAGRIQVEGYTVTGTHFPKDAFWASCAFVAAACLPSSSALAAWSEASSAASRRFSFSRETRSLPTWGRTGVEPAPEAPAPGRRAPGPPSRRPSVPVDAEWPTPWIGLACRDRECPWASASAAVALASWDIWVGGGGASTRAGQVEGGEGREWAGCVCVCARWRSSLPGVPMGTLPSLKLLRGKERERGGERQRAGNESGAVQGCHSSAALTKSRRAEVATDTFSTRHAPVWLGIDRFQRVGTIARFQEGARTLAMPAGRQT